MLERLRTPNFLSPWIWLPRQSQSEPEAWKLPKVSLVFNLHWKAEDWHLMSSGNWWQWWQQEQKHISAENKAGAAQADIQVGLIRHHHLQHLCKSTHTTTREIAPITDGWDCLELQSYCKAKPLEWTDSQQSGKKKMVLGMVQMGC